LAGYAQSIVEAYKFLRFGSLDRDWIHYDRRIGLEHVYVPQSVKSALPPYDLTQDHLKELKSSAESLPWAEMQIKRLQYEELLSVPILEVVDDPAHSRLVILGDPGLGKSTLLKFLALRWAHEPNGPLTLLLELRRTVRESGRLIFSLTWRMVSARPCHCPG
jgi:hypothetical protein